MQQLPCLIILGLVSISGHPVEGQSCQSYSIGISDPNKIPDTQITASSSLSSETRPYHARIGSVRGAGWCAKSKRDGEFLQVDLGGDYVLCGIFVQGGFYGHVITFDLQFSRDGSFYSPYSQTLVRVNDQEQDAEFHALGPYPVGRYVRFFPRRYIDLVCARIELYGFPGPKVTCTPQHILAEFNKRNYPDLEAQGMHLKNTSCLATEETTTQIVFKIPLRGCGTMRKTLTGHLQYSNEVIRRITVGTISYKMDMVFPISCNYDRNVTVGDVNFEVEAEEPTDAAASLKPVQGRLSFISWLVRLWLPGALIYWISVAGLLTPGRQNF